MYFGPPVTGVNGAERKNYAWGVFYFRRDISLELSHGCSVGSVATDQNRASSLSSEEGVAAAAAAAAASGGAGQANNNTHALTTGNSLESNSSSVSATTAAALRNQASYPSSPRADR